MTTSQSISWTDIAREAVDHLAHILAHGTSSPPAWELPAAKYLLNLFESEGIPAILLPPESGTAFAVDKSIRPNLVAHIPGSEAGEPLLLLSHLDSAPRTTHDLDLPGRTITQTLRGPGALMGTHLAIAQAMALILLARSGVPLNRTVRFAATSEGAGGKGIGLRMLVDNHLEHITSDMAIGWGAFSWIEHGDVPCSLLASAEKGSLNLVLRSEGGGGRAGVRTGDDPVERLVKAIYRLSEMEFPVRPSRASEELVDSVAAMIPDRVAGEIFKDLNKEATAGKALECVEMEPSFDPGLKALLRAALRTEQVVVSLNASAAEGLRPSVAEAEIHYCFPPGEDVEGIAMRVMEILKSDGVYLARKSVVEPSECENATEIQAIARAALTDVDPKAKLIVGLTPWPTGLSALRQYGTKVFGWEPFATTGALSDTLSCRGGPGEMIDADNFVREIRAFYSFLIRIVT